MAHSHDVISTLKKPSLPFSSPATVGEGSVMLTEEQELEVLARIKAKRTIWITGKSAPFTDDFRPSVRIGSVGTYGSVYRCKALRGAVGTGAFAVKEIPKSKFYRIKAEDMRLRYLRSLCSEIDVMKMLGKHPHVVRLHSVYEDKPHLRLVMEECVGGELFQRIRESAIPEPLASSITQQMCDALKFMHEEYNIVHCDLKPANVLFVDAERTQIKIIDFGMAKVLQRLSYLSDLVGTPYYTAPEVIPVGDTTPRYAHPSDMWSVGAIVFAMIFAFPCFIVDQTRYTGMRERKAIYRKILRGFYPQVVDVKKHGFGPWFPNDRPSTKPVRELIGKLMDKDTAARYSAQDVLMHPWITSGGVEEDLSATTVPTASALLPPDLLPKAKGLLTSVAKFAKASAFRDTVVKLFEPEYKRLRPGHFETLERLFFEMDTNGDGVISYVEFRDAILKLDALEIGEAEIREMFEGLISSDDAADDSTDAVEGVRFCDLLACVVHDYLVACDDRLWQAFNALDTDEDGFIKVSELISAMGDADNLDEGARAEEIVAHMGLSDDGLIDYEHFLLELHPKFGEAPVWVPKLYGLKSVAVERDATSKRKAKKKGVATASAVDSKSPAP